MPVEPGADHGSHARQYPACPARVHTNHRNLQQLGAVHCERNERQIKLEIKDCNYI